MYIYMFIYTFMVFYIVSYFRGVITVTRDGTRRVSLGRGYTLYEFPDEDPNLEGHIDKVYERRNAVCFKKLFE